MKTFYTSLIFILSFFINQNSIAQCSEIYIYRTNGFQSKRAVDLFYDGNKLATVNAGERYKATVCSLEGLELVVRTSDKDMVPSKIDFKPKSGKNYYLKVSCAVGVEIASIKLQHETKGKKDVNNGSKFIKPFKVFSIQNNAVAQNNNTSSSNNVTNTDKVFNGTHIVDNFKFEIIDLTKAGENLTINYKITNLAPDDRRLESCPNMMYFYDDLGNLKIAERSCLSNSCFTHPSYQKSKNVLPKYSCYSNMSSNAILPSGIPLNGQIIIHNINSRATKFIRGTVWFKSEVDFKIDYFNIEFPKVIDPNNPNKRNFGKQSIELTDAVKDSTATYIAFNHLNDNVEPYTSKIKSGIAYDDKGNQYAINAMSFVTKDKRVNYKRYGNWSYVTNPNSETKTFAIIDKISSSATQIRRITLEFDGFSLSWENINIKGAVPIKEKPDSNYILYSDFEKKVRTNQNVLGTKVILKNIYFSTGSAEILTSSHAQLNQLADLLNLNKNLKVEVSGHTDSVGDDISNMLLSQKRADALKYYLMGKSVAPNKIISIGKGENEPIDSNETVDGRQENRRVEILVVK